MANSKAPRHDFAPAWLKIPSNEGLKSSGSKSADHGDKSGRPRRDDYHGGFNRFPNNDYMYGPVQRQRSFENYYDERRYSPQKFRHHSGEEDHFSPPYAYNYPYNVYNYDQYNGPYRNQSTLFRDGKYHHPNSRYCQMNGGFPPPPPPPPPPYYDPYFYEYYTNEYYYPNHMRGMNGHSGGNSVKRYPSGDKEKSSVKGSEKDRDSKNQDSEHDTKKQENLEEEFPSLNGDSENSDSKPVAKSVPSSSVWDKGPSAKLVNGKGASVNGDGPASHISDGQSKDSSNRQQNSNIYKSLVPKASLPRKSTKDAGKLGGPSKDLNSNLPGPAKLPSSGSSPYKVVNNKDGNKEGNCSSPTPPIDILNTRLVTTPKTLTDKKSEFLKTLRKDKSAETKKFDLTAKDDGLNRMNTLGGVEQQIPLQNGTSKHHEDTVLNGVNDLSLHGDIVCELSSSLEAEQRLLKEMGWNEDDEEYEITEDEKREFEEKCSQQLKEHRNGFKKALPTTWSPQHLMTYMSGVHHDEDDDEASSLSEDSDLE